jgi:hypothetical protein
MLACRNFHTTTKTHLPNGESSMKRLLLLLSATAAFAAAPKSYQVTGPVLELRPDAIVVQKGSEKWEIARDSSQGAGLKVGQKVTIQYTMAVKSIESKDAKPAGDSVKVAKKAGKKK